MHVLGDQPRASAIGEVRPRPLEQHQHAVAEADQEEDVHEDPDQPREESAEMELPDVSHGLAAADDRELAFVPVAEGPAGPAGQIAPDDTRGILSPLDRDGADAPQPSALL